MKKKANDRLQSAGEVEQLLLECIAHCEHPNKQPLPKQLNVRPRKPHARQWVIATTVVVGGAIALATQLPIRVNRPSEPSVSDVAKSSVAPGISSELLASPGSYPTANETEWYDSFEPTSLDVKTNALRLDAETRLFFASQQLDNATQTQGTR